MANETFEKALKIVQALPPQDQRRLRQWIEEHEQKRISQSVNDETKPASHSEREMRWLAEHEAEYAGQWIAWTVIVYSVMAPTHMRCGMRRGPPG